MRSPMVSGHHASLRKDAEHWVIEDLNSSNGTFVNGMRLAKPRKLLRGDVIAVGPVRYTFDETALLPRASAGGVRIAARGLSKVVENRQTGLPLTLLNHIELTIEPREFVVLLGQSGCGKSTFMDTLNGRRPATEGAVIYDGEDLYENFDALKSAVGYVPQEVIFHDALPLADTLRYSAHLRLPRDTSATEVEANIDRVLKIVGLAERRATCIRDLSGGQKKRVSIAIELLSAPQVLFLDEVTSGLDPGTEQQMMQLFRTLADDGMTIVCVTHHLDSLGLTDALAYFFKGRLVYFGPPDQLPEHFGIPDLRAIYEAEESATPEAWEHRFKASKTHNIFVKLRSQTDAAGPGQKDSPALRPSARTPGLFLRQWKILTLRYIKLLRMEYRNLLLLLGLAPAVAVMLCISANSINVTENPAAAGTKQNLLCFGASIIILFLALFGSVREIVKEIHIFKHERFINLRLIPYFLSKALPLMLVGLLQVVMVTLVLHLAGGMHAGGMGLDVLVLGLVSVVGTLMGLAISAAAASSDWAIISMIAIVIPEIIFSGALVPANGFSGIISKSLIGIYWAIRALLGELDDATRASIPGNPPAGQAFNGILVLVIHALVMALATLLLLAAKDSHGPISRMLARLRNLFAKLRRRRPAAA